MTPGAAVSRRHLGLAAGLALVAVITVADVVEGEATAYVGVLTSTPFLAAVFARPRDVVAVGAVALVGGALIGVEAGTGLTQAQVVRLLLICVATAVAAVAAGVRERREHELREVTGVAEVAQEAILRPLPAQVGAVALAGRYRSAAQSARVGGDFYDVANTPHGVRLIVGDVRGKGLDAVRVAAAVLGSFREAAFSAGPDLATVARVVSDAVDRHRDAEDFVTAVFVQLDADGRGQVVRCGHPAPLLLGDGGVRAIGVEPEQPPLGLLLGLPAAVPVALAPGERLLLYTDGLSEARRPGGLFFDVGAAAGGLVTGGLEQVLDDLVGQVTAHTGGALSDDLAVLLLERREAAQPARAASGGPPGG
jgi:serine phosphatase RsbU (regulator of sigma subunit)